MIPQLAGEEWKKGVCATTADICNPIANRKPPIIHPDPFDRLLIATAILADFKRITPDRNIPKYPGIHTFWSPSPSTNHGKSMIQKPLTADDADNTERIRQFHGSISI